MKQFKDYEEFDKYMMESYPLMYKERWGGFEIGKGWWGIVDILSRFIQGHIDWTNQRRELLLRENPYKVAIPDEVPQVQVTQIKEKFAGLRFYYDGGDKKIDGYVTMAEAWCGHTCEECGMPGRTRKGSWIRTLCDYHAKEQKYVD